MSTIEERVSAFRHLRGVTSPCPKCSGMGVRVYGSGATWRGGMGCAAMTWDVCDTCWGTGDTERTGANLREMERERCEWEEDQCVAWMARRLGVGLADTRRYVLMLADLAQKEERRRKIPEGFAEFWWANNWRAIASILRKIAGEEVRRG